MIVEYHATAHQSSDTLEEFRVDCFLVHSRELGDDLPGVLVREDLFLDVDITECDFLERDIIELIGRALKVADDDFDVCLTDFL